MSASPIAQDDTLIALNTEPIVIAILANDTAPEGSSLNPDSITITVGNAFGTLDIDYLQGLLIYTPEAGFIGTETFAYVVTDMEGNLSNEATVTVNLVDVLPDPDPDPDEDKDALVLVTPDGNKLSKLTLRRNGELLEIVNNRTEEVILNHLLSDVASLSIISPDGSLAALQLTVDFAFGGGFILSGGLTVTGGTQTHEDSLILRGSSGNDELSIEDQHLLFNGLSITTASVEQLKVTMGLGDDALSLTGRLAFESVTIDDQGGDDLYTLAFDEIAGAAGKRTLFKATGVTINDRKGDDAYAISATAGSIAIVDGRGFDTLDFSSAEAGVRFSALNPRQQSTGLGTMQLSASLGLERIIGSDFDDLFTAGIRNSLIEGGIGNDTLQALLGNHLLLGGEGDDQIVGGLGRDILIGGQGSDRLNGGIGDDLLIGGTTSFDHDLDALLAIMKEWTSKRPFHQRIANLVNGSGSAVRYNAQFFLAPGESVLDDGDNDRLDGGLGRDWAVMSDHKLHSIEKVG